MRDVIVGGAVILSLSFFVGMALYAFAGVFLILGTAP